jgi:hypothetical protein
MRLSYWKQWIGPNSWGILRYLLPYNKLFHWAAVLHDNLYYISYNKQRADDMFYRAMLWVSHNSLQRIFARIYYFLVKNFWFLFYN